MVLVNQMAKLGNCVVFKKNYCKIYNKNHQLIASATLKNDLYQLNWKIIKPKCTESALIAKDSVDIWHRRMGHICHSNLIKVKNSTIGINGVLNEYEHCKICALGKQSRAPFKFSGKRANNLLEIIHSDVCGPLKTKSESGAKYFVTFIDDYSRHVTVVPIKEKAQVYAEFVRYKNFVENQCSQKIKIFRTDNGTEFCNGQFTQLLEKCGIHHQKSAPYVHEQHGAAERINRTLIERVRCMLVDAELKHSFWAEAVVTAAY